MSEYLIKRIYPEEVPKEREKSYITEFGIATYGAFFGHVGFHDDENIFEPDWFLEQITFEEIIKNEK